MKTKALPTLSSRLTRWYCLSYGAVLLLAFAVLYLAISWILDFRLDEDLIEDVEEFQLLYRQQGIERVTAEIVREEQSGNSEEFFVVVLSRQGGVILSSDLSRWPLFDPAQVGFDSSDEATLQTLELAARDLTTRIASADLGDGLRIIIGESTAEKAEILQLLSLVILVTLLLAIPVTALVGRAITRRAVRGIEAVSRTALAIDYSALDARVDASAGCAEVEQLTQAFNAMLDRIRNLIVGMHELTDNLSHDLRSPLARIRAMAETALTAVDVSEDHKTSSLRTMEECDRLLQMINTSLDISELEAGVGRINKVTTDISAIVEDACELFEPLAEEKNIRFEFRRNGDCKLMGNLQSLQRMLANLLDNAIKYTPEGGTVAVEVDCSNADIQIAVRDTGVGIEPAEHIKIFERFYRCDQSRSRQGCGLGLSFARAVARAHGGDISVSGNGGQGSCFTVSLPKRQSGSGQ